MKSNQVLSAVVAAAFALPLALGANAGNTKSKTADASTATSTSAKNDGGAEAMFTSMDKNGDGFISREEAAGTPHAASFATLDRDGDGKLSRDEHASAKEHMGASNNMNPGSSSATSLPSGASDGKTKPK